MQTHWQEHRVGSASHLHFTTTSPLLVSSSDSSAKRLGEHLCPTTPPAAVFKARIISHQVYFLNQGIIKYGNITNFLQQWMKITVDMPRTSHYSQTSVKNIYAIKMYNSLSEDGYLEFETDTHFFKK